MSHLLTAERIQCLLCFNSFVLRTPVTVAFMFWVFICVCVCGDRVMALVLRFVFDS